MEEVLIIQDYIWEDVLNIIFTDDINARIKEGSELNNFDPKEYLVDDNVDGVVCDIEEPNYRSHWLLFNYDHCNIGVIVHECNHLTFKVLSKRDIWLNEETKEVYAYTEQWLFNKIYNFYLNIGQEVNPTQDGKEI